jgi:hypothetical protein
MQLAARYYACLELAVVALGALALSGNRAEPDDVVAIELPTREPLRVVESRVPARPPPLVLLAEAVQPEIGPDESLPIAFTLLNTTDHTLEFLSSLDGSAYERRYPKIRIDIRDREGNLVEPHPNQGCGNSANLETEDFQILEAGREGEVFGPGAFGHWRFHEHDLAPGTYTVTMTYDLTFSEYGGDAELIPDYLKARVAALPLGKYTSAPVTIMVRP